MNFIHFGCWNNGKCDTTKGDTSISQVMNKINEFRQKNPVNFAVISGDNYYDSGKIKKDKTKEENPLEDKTQDKTKEKKEKVKMFNKDNFISGVECLKNSLPGIKKYILLGNHEYDKVSGDDIEDKEKCNLMRLQQKTFTIEERFKFFTNIMIEESFNTLIIMIDTTLYEYKEEFDKYCNEVFPEINKDRTYENLIKYQQHRVTDILNQHENKKNIVIIGHHPIITVKGKEDKEKKEVLDGLVELFKNIKLLLKDKNIYYLCADNHLQQEGQIIINDLYINQFVSGTGGAELDKCIKEEKKEFGFDNLKYNMIKCKSINGFYYVRENGEKLEFYFIEADSIVKQQGGYKEKYLKYKQKYLNLKKNLK